jgi:aspartate aminotransferase
MVSAENMLITQGSSEGLAYSMWAVAEQGDEIIVFEPFFVNYSLYSHFDGVKIKAVTTSIENDYHLPGKAEIVKAITPKTRAILYTNPNNPTGTVYTKREVEMLVEIAEEYNLYLISDEVYRELNFSGRKHISILEYYDRIKDRIILSDSLSKRYCLCGARLGSLIVFNPELYHALYKLTTSRLSASYIEQKVCASLGGISEDYSIELTKEFRHRRNTCNRILGNVEGIKIGNPEGAFYIMVKLPIKNAMDFATWLLTDFEDKNETVLVTPASGFYQTRGKGSDEIRIAYVLEEKKLSRALELILLGLEKYLKTGQNKNDKK